MTPHEIWQAVLAELELSISKANFITWFKNTTIIACHDGQVVLCVPNAFTRAWLEKKYHLLIIKSVERITGKPIKKLDYKIDSLKNVLRQAVAGVVDGGGFPVGFHPPKDGAPGSVENNGGGFVLSPRYAFDTFVVGKGNELAFAAAQAVCRRPGTAYNPLFIYGGVGLGKTHLLQAIGNQLRLQQPESSVVYVSAEKFSNDFINSIKDRGTKDFQRRYRQIDLLLVDDIQFIAGKDGTQESFFHTFNELHQHNKQVVLTSDRPPKAIPALEDRLRSRLEWGMIADVAPPDFETRVAILAKKCLEKNFSLPDKLTELVATLVQTNIRELEGALNKIIVYHQLKGFSPTVESVRVLLALLPSPSVRQILTAPQLLEVVGQFYHLSREEILGKNREKKISLPRQVIMYLLREELKMSYPAIGEELGGRDHTTAMHAYEKICHGLEDDLRLKQEVELLKQRLYINNM